MKDAIKSIVIDELKKHGITDTGVLSAIGSTIATRLDKAIGIDEDVIAEKILRETIYEQIDKHWNEVLFDGEKCVHVYSIPDEMYVCIWNQIYETLEHLILKYKIHFGDRNDAINAMCKKVNSTIH